MKIEELIGSDLVVDFDDVKTLEFAAVTGGRYWWRIAPSPRRMMVTVEDKQAKRVTGNVYVLQENGEIQSSYLVDENGEATEIGRKEER